MTVCPRCNEKPVFCECPEDGKCEARYFWDEEYEEYKLKEYIKNPELRCGTCFATLGKCLHTQGQFNLLEKTMTE